MKRNRWQQIIYKHLKTAGAPQTTTQILDAIEATGFKHGSKNPRSTIGARLAEMRREGFVKRTAPSTWAIEA